MAKSYIDKLKEKYPQAFKNRINYKELMSNDHYGLTDQEVIDGWHFCNESDGLLIHESWREFEVCHCFKP